MEDFPFSSFNLSYKCLESKYSIWEAERPSCGSPSAIIKPGYLHLDKLSHSLNTCFSVGSRSVTLDSPAHELCLNWAFICGGYRCVLEVGELILCGK